MVVCVYPLVDVPDLSEHVLSLSFIFRAFQQIMFDRFTLVGFAGFTFIGNKQFGYLLVPRLFDVGMELVFAVIMV